MARHNTTSGGTLILTLFHGLLVVLSSLEIRLRQKGLRSSTIMAEKIMTETSVLVALIKIAGIHMMLGESSDPDLSPVWFIHLKAEMVETHVQYCFSAALYLLSCPITLMCVLGSWLNEMTERGPASGSVFAYSVTNLTNISDQCLFPREGTPYNQCHYKRK